MIATIILLVIQILNLGITLAKNGEPKEGKYNFWARLLAVIILIVLYYYAGLFDNFK
jgi:hypothetical protein